MANNPRGHGAGKTAGRRAPNALIGPIGQRVDEIAQRYAPAYVVVDETYEVLHFSDRTGGFLEPTSGAASLDLLNLVHRDLRLDLRAALHKAVSQKARSEARNVCMGANGVARAINIAVEPILSAGEADAFVVLFQDAGPAAELEPSPSINEQLQSVNDELANRVTDLARANSDLKSRLDSTQIATLFLDNDLRLRAFTPAASDVFHLREADVGRPIADIDARVTYPELQEDARRVLKSLGQVEREVASTEEDRRFLVRVLPHRNVDNFIAGVVVTFLEVSGAARAEAALRISEHRFAAAQSLADVGAWEWNLETDELWWSPVVYKLFGLPASDDPPPVTERLVHPDDLALYVGSIEAAKRTGELNLEWRVQLPDGSARWLAGLGRLDRGRAGRRMLGITQDVTHRKQTETRLKLLLGELQHRVRNILGVVRSLVARSVRSATSIDELAAHLDGRLGTLARTQSVFTRTGVGMVDLEELVRDEMVAVAAREEQLTIEGPLVRLRREAAETFALALHELATNAVKYGALSEPAGQVSVTWRILNTNSGARLSLEWQEAGVRALDVKPARIGFGRELIERGLPYELGATTALDYSRGGVRALIEVPLTEKIAELGANAVQEVAE